MYGKFSVGYKIIPEKATVIPQFQQTPLEDEYNAMQPICVSTLPGTTDMVTPIAKSTPVTQASQIPVLPLVPSNESDILEPMSSEQARSAYLERQMQGMSRCKATFRHAFIGERVTQICKLAKIKYKPFVKSRRRKESTSVNLLKWL